MMTNNEEYNVHDQQKKEFKHEDNGMMSDKNRVMQSNRFFIYIPVEVRNHLGRLIYSGLMKLMLKRVMRGIVMKRNFFGLMLILVLGGIVIAHPDNVCIYT